MNYKKQEIQEHFNDSIINYDKEWIENNQDDLHHEIFNTDYYIIGSYKATQWLGDQVFNIIDFIKGNDVFVHTWLNNDNQRWISKLERYRKYTKHRW